MYWWPYEDQEILFYRKRQQTARIEHRCIECHQIIPVDITYVYVVMKWYDPSLHGGYKFDTLKLCLNCDEDWDKILRIYHENDDEGACIVYGSLKLAIKDALFEDYLDANNPLSYRWFPGFFEGTGEDRDTLERINASLNMRANSLPFV